MLKTREIIYHHNIRESVLYLLRVGKNNNTIIPLENPGLQHISEKKSSYDNQMNDIQIVVILKLFSSFMRLFF